MTVTNYTPPSTRNVTGYADVSGANVLFKWKRTLSDSSDFQFQAYYDRTNRLEPNLGENRDTGDVDFLGRVRLGPRNQLLYGAGARASDGRFIEVTSGLVFYPFHRLDYLFSAFLEDDLTLVNRKLVLMLGSKMIRTNYTGFAFEPSVRLMWTPDDRITFWTSFTHALRTPSDAEEDFYLSSNIGSLNGTPFFARFNANPYFAPEQLNSYEVGYRQLITKNFYLDLAGFFNHYHNLFSEEIRGGLSIETTLPYPSSVPPPTYVLLPAQFQNGLYGATYGGEIAPEWRPTKFWRLRASYSFLRMSLKQAPSKVGEGLGASNTEGSSPQHEVSFDSSFDISKNLQADFIYRFVSSLPAQGVPAYSTADVRTGYQLTRHLWFSVVGQNLFQPWHVEYIGDPGGPAAIRRSIYASLAWR